MEEESSLMLCRVNWWERAAGEGVFLGLSSHFCHSVNQHSCQSSFCQKAAKIITNFHSLIKKIHPQREQKEDFRQVEMFFMKLLHLILKSKLEKKLPQSKKDVLNIKFIINFNLFRNFFVFKKAFVTKNCVIMLKKTVS